MKTRFLIAFFLCPLLSFGQFTFDSTYQISARNYQNALDIPDSIAAHKGWPDSVRIKVLLADNYALRGELQKTREETILLTIEVDMFKRRVRQLTKAITDYQDGVNRVFRDMRQSLLYDRLKKKVAKH